MQNKPGSVSATPYMCIHTTTPFSPYSQAHRIKNKTPAALMQNLQNDWLLH